MTMTLSEAKARLSEVVRTVRRERTRIIITVDGEPAVAISPIETTPAALSAAQIRVARALENAILALPQRAEPFDAVELIRDGRR